MRKLASIKKIDEIRPIPDADSIELCILGGWQTVVKKGEYQVGDLAVYAEIDSWIPTELAPYLSKGKEPKEYNGVKGERLRTVKLRGALSQGLLLPIDILTKNFASGIAHEVYQEGDDLTEYLNIQKWEAPIPAQLAGQVRGNFPAAVPKTDQERIQTLVRETKERYDSGVLYEITEKMEGSSCTMFLDRDGEFHVCSRNLDLKRDENNSFWRAAIKFDVEAKMREHQLNGWAIQGELIGPGIQGNHYGLKDIEFLVFDVYNSITGNYLSPRGRQKLISDMNLTHVPVLHNDVPLLSDKVENLLPMADLESELNRNVLREGIVFKAMDGSHSFKIISNKYLLGQA